MRTLLKGLAVLVILVLVVAGGGLAYLFASYPNVPPASTVTLPNSTDVIARGQYLAERVAICVDCHSERDWSKFAGPIKPGTYGKGGEKFTRETDGIPGTIYVPNITPAALGSWTDGELLHAVTTGVSRDGRAMFPIMPYPNYGRAAEDDVTSILAYIRTLPPIANGGQPLPGKSFAGGMEFRSPLTGYRVRPANITPDADTGIGQWTEEQFINKFKGFETPDDRVLSDAEQRQNTPMPWTQYAGMAREDLGAIYTYLRTLKPVTSRIEIPRRRVGNALKARVL